MAWEMKGRYPDILNDPTKGPEARKLFEDAQAMLSRLINGSVANHSPLIANGIIGFYPANSVGDDIELYTDESRTERLTTIHTLRQQQDKGLNKEYLALADFIAPQESGVADYMGLFAVTTGIGVDEWVQHYETAYDDYSAIMVKALADRLAEAFAEWMHEQVRRQYWGYAAQENLSNEALIAEQYQGIRPAPGYPACPDHTEKRTLFELMDVPSMGLTLTENCAMTPTAAVSGFYFAHPQSRYFHVGKIGSDQVKDYATRKGWSIAETERWLRPNLG